MMVMMTTMMKCWCIFLWQNYFGDPWNVLDFVIVIGSIVDIIAGRLLVSRDRNASVPAATYARHAPVLGLLQNSTF